MYKRQVEQQSNFDDNVAITLPRLSFELTSYTYDATRKSSPVQKFTMKSPTSKTKIKKMYLPVPYDIGFRLSFATKQQDDSLQIIEQILPFFQPSYAVTINMLEGVEEKRDIPFTLMSTSFTDEYEGDFSTRRFIQYDLDFIAKTYFYQEVPTDEFGIIKKVQVDYSTAIRAPREQRYVVTPQATKDYNNDLTGTLTESLDKVKTIVQVVSGAAFTTQSYIEIGTETMRIKEITGNNLLVARGQFGTGIMEHSKGDRVNKINQPDHDAIELGDTFGFSESRSFFDSDGKEWSPTFGDVDV